MTRKEFEDALEIYAHDEKVTREITFTLNDTDEHFTFIGLSNVWFELFNEFVIIHFQNGESTNIPYSVLERVYRDFCEEPNDDSEELVIEWKDGTYLYI